MSKLPYATIEDLPYWVRDQVRVITRNPETWVFRPIPALRGRSLMQVINSNENGEDEVRKFLSRAVGMLT